jgi:hypothetical protein
MISRMGRTSVAESGIENRTIDPSIGPTCGVLSRAGAWS